MPEKPPSPSLGVGKAGAIALALSGLLVMAVLIVHADPDDVLRDVLRIGWGLAAVAAFHVAVIGLDAMAWRILLRGSRAGIPFFLWARWIRESINTLLPVAQVGGEVVGARLLTLHGTRLKTAGVSLVLDKLAEGLSLVPFTLLGLAGFIMLKGGGNALVRGFVTALAVLSALGLGLAVARRAGVFRLVKHAVIAFAAKRGQPLLASVSGIAQAFESVWQGGRFAASTAIHLLAWCAGAFEMWLALRFMGSSLDFGRVLILESLGQAIMRAGFLVPAGLGVQEGSYVLVGAALGLPPGMALALALVKRLRQLSLGLPALAAWQLFEFRRMLTTGRRPRERLPSSASNSYVRRIARAAVAPFAGTGLTPNHVTTLRILAAMGACVACAAGGTAWNHGAALLWVAATVLDRADGEFARLTGLSSKWGHVYDYRSDVAINASVFLAFGVNLGRHGWGAWALLLGAAAAAVVAADAVLAEHLENRIGRKSFPARSGFDFDDFIFLIAPFMWFGAGLPLLAGAAAVGPAVGLVLWRRLAASGGGRRAPSTEDGIGMEAEAAE